MRVLVVTTYYAPDLGPGAALFTMLCEDLARLGHHVSVIAAVPHYPTGRVQPEFRGRLFRRQRTDSVNITRVWVPSVNRSILPLRFLTFVVFQFLSALSALRRSCDVVIVGNPALEVFLPFLVLSLRRKPILFSIHDLYPDVGMKLGIFRHKSVIRTIEFMESFCMRRAACIRVLSRGFWDAIKARGIPEHRLRLIWDWQDTDLIRPQPRNNEFSTEWNLNSFFVVLYAGNMSFSQGLENVIETANLLKEKRNIRFVFVGDGAARSSLESLVQAQCLENVQFIPFQPRHLLPLVLASADVSLISLKCGLSSDSVPSKAYSILASGRAVIACVDHNSDTMKLIDTADCGITVSPEQPKELAAAIQRIYCDAAEKDQFADNGRKYMIQHHSRAAAAAHFHEALVFVLASASPKRERN